MSDNPAGKSTRQGADERANRLAQALRENLKRRKAQARGRARPPAGQGALGASESPVSPPRAATAPQD